MRLVLFACLILLSAQACVTSRIKKDGFEQKALGLRVSLAPGSDKDIIDNRWVADTKSQRYSVRAKSQKGIERNLSFDSYDFMLKHKETRGVIGLQSFPLDEVMAERKLEILAKDYAERASGSYFVSLGLDLISKVQADAKTPNVLVLKTKDELVTTITASKAGTMGSASTYQIDFEVRNASINPEQVLRKYRMLLIRPQIESGWMYSFQDGGFTSSMRFPALVVVTLANDAEYFQETQAAFDTLVQRIQL